MKKRILAIFGITVLMAVCLCAGAMAAGGLQQIQAYLNRDITIKLDGQTQIMYDAKGNRVYPVSYNGTTYVPIRAVSNMLGIDVDWDGPSNTVLLGKTGTAKDFIEDLEPYYTSGVHRYTAKDATSRTIAGKKYSTYMVKSSGRTDYCARYDLGGKYTTLTFSAYTEESMSGGNYIQLFGDNDELIANLEITPEALPETYTVDLTGVTQLTISSTVGDLYIFNATIE